MNNDHPQYREGKDDETPKGGRVEMEQDQSLGNTLNALGEIQDAILHDTSVTTGIVNALGKHLGKLTVSISGSEFTVEQLRTDPDLQKSVEIWKAILSGAEADSGDLAYLCDDVAKLLVEEKTNKHVFLDLSHLRTISDQQAEILSRFRGDILNLNRLPRLTEKQAKALGAISCTNLSLGGVETLSPSQAKAFSTFTGCILQLNGIAKLTDDALSHLIAYGQINSNRNMLHLGGLMRLTDTQAEILASYPGDCLELYGVTNLTQKQCELFAACTARWLGFGGLPTLDLPALRALMPYKGRLDLSGLHTLTDEQAVALTTFKGTDLHLQHLASLTKKQAMILAPMRERIHSSRAINTQLAQVSSTLQ